MVQGPDPGLLDAATDGLGLYHRCHSHLCLHLSLCSHLYQYQHQHQGLFLPQCPDQPLRQHSEALQPHHLPSHLLPTHHIAPNPFPPARSRQRQSVPGTLRVLRPGCRHHLWYRQSRPLVVSWACACSHEIPPPQPHNPTDRPVLVPRPRASIRR